MRSKGKSTRLKKELSLLDIYAVALGATLSSSFFLLPGLAAAQAGSAVVIAYLLAAVHVLPGVYSQAELSTAMPRAGGVYYYIDRSLGALIGAIGGLGTWLVLILKAAFALIGMGAYLGLYFPEMPIRPVAMGLAIVFGVLNLFGAKKTGGFQAVLVGVVVLALFWFMGHGIFEIRLGYFTGLFEKGFDKIYATAGMVFISYAGITKISSISEEVKNPERNLPLGMFLALLTAVLIYGIGVTVMVGVVPPQQLYHDLTPVATAARIFSGEMGVQIVTIAAMIAFFSGTNAAILSASRFPLAMSRDQLAPGFFARINRFGTPSNAIIATAGLIIACLVLFDPTKIAKLASGFQLLLFALSCAAVIIMRESKIEAYDPGYKSPLYPWMQIFGIIAPFFLIAEMGWYTALFTLGMIGLGILLYYKYAKGKVARGGAIFHIFARLGARRFEGLDLELREILKEKGLRSDDPFDLLVARAAVVDIEHKAKLEEITWQVAALLAERCNRSPEQIFKGFMEGTRVGATPVSHGVALPHLRLEHIDHQEMVIVRSRQGIQVEIHAEGEKPHRDTVYAIFFLLSSTQRPRLHLRLLAQLATIVEEDNFLEIWLAAQSELELKEILLRTERYLTVTVDERDETRVLIGKRVSELAIPERALIAMIHRNGEVRFPRGSTRLHAGDRLTIIGDPMDIVKLKQLISQSGLLESGIPPAEVSSSPVEQ